MDTTEYCAECFYINYYQNFPEILYFDRDLKCQRHRYQYLFNDTYQMADMLIISVSFIIALFLGIIILLNE